MREELKGPKVEGVSVALVELPLDNNEKEYIVYLLSEREDIIEGIIVASTGYGEDPQTGEAIQTSTLRRGIELLLPNEAARIEPIMPELFDLSNEYWVSFWADDVMYDKRFVFVAGSIQPDQFVWIEQLNAKGILLS
ncbi:MAG: hypothetical protein RLZZ301_1020 [Bacteroidota bacterium]|jgi:hypothetical protein